MVKRTLYFGNPAHLSTENLQLVVKQAETAQKITIPIEDLGMVVLDHAQISITQPLLAQLAENKVSVLTFNARHVPIALMLPMEGNVLAQKYQQAQLSASEPLKKQLWAQTVKAKILHQAFVLKQQNLPQDNMLKWAEEIKSGDSTNLEARAAAYYWKQIFENPHFIRDRQGNFPNSFLNYGYAVLRAMTARSLVCAGLLPSVGIHHKNQYNAYCLADDVMEPYRPYVDALVLDWIAKYPDAEELDKDAKAHLLQIATLDVSIQKNKSPLMHALDVSSTSLRKCFEGELKKMQYPEIK
jgi:CRISPR-associated protein Cas1